jgi:serine/threonine protein phosphatase 1
LARILAVGDVHGETALLRDVLTAARYTPGRDKLVLLGDYIDRGPDSLGTLNAVRELVALGAIALRGNHEQLMVDVLACRADMNEWLAKGGAAAIRSFAASRPDGSWRSVAVEWADFLASLPLLHTDPPYVFAHAGIRPGPARQSDEDLLNIRAGFLSRPGEPWPGRTVVFGHTKTRGIEGHGLDLPWLAPGRIGLNTGAGAGGPLTCMELPCGRFWQARPGGRGRPPEDGIRRPG